MRYNNCSIYYYTHDAALHLLTLAVVFLVALNYNPTCYFALWATYRYMNAFEHGVVKQNNCQT